MGFADNIDDADRRTAHDSPKAEDLKRPDLILFSSFIDFTFLQFEAWGKIHAAEPAILPPRHTPEKKKADLTSHRKSPIARILLLSEGSRKPMLGGIHGGGRGLRGKEGLR